MLCGTQLVKAEGERKDSVRRSDFAKDTGTVKKAIDTEDTMVYEDYDDRMIEKRKDNDFGNQPRLNRHCTSVYFIDYTPIPNNSLSEEVSPEFPFTNAESETSEPDKLVAYPNPLRSGAQLHTKGGQGTLILRDATGKVIRTNSAGDPMNLNVVPGTYYLSGENNEMELYRIIVSP